MRYIEIRGVGMQGHLTISSGLAKVVLQNIPIDVALECALQNKATRILIGEFIVIEFPISEILYASEEFEGEDYKIFSK